MAVLMIVFLCLIDWGISWMATWYLWVFVLLPFPFYYFRLRADKYSAGADWIAVKGGHVDTYELVSVKVVVTSGGMASDIQLKDRSDNELHLALRPIQMNRDLWDLIYNGILYSVQHGATTNRQARDKLHLDET